MRYVLAGLLSFTLSMCGSLRVPTSIPLMSLGHLTAGGKTFGLYYSSGGMACPHRTKPGKSRPDCCVLV